MAKNLSVRQTEALVRKYADESKQPPTKTKSVNPDVKSLQDALSEKLGAKVKIDYNNQGKGRLTIAYNSLDELDGILAHLR